MVFVYLRLFDRTMAGVLTDEDMQIVEQHLLDNPRAGAVMAHTGGVRKPRVAIQGRGKRGSARVIYLQVPARSKIYCIMVYAKSDQATLTEAEKRQIQALVYRLKEEH